MYVYIIYMYTYIYEIYIKYITLNIKIDIEEWLASWN